MWYVVLRVVGVEWPWPQGGLSNMMRSALL